MKLFSFINKLFPSKKKEYPARYDETVTRFVNNKNKTFPSKGKLHHNAFKPPKNYPREISVFCIREFLDFPEKIWQLADRLLSFKAEERGDLLVSEITKIETAVGKHLTVMVDKAPHANIKDIPLEEAKRNLAATQLSNISTLKKKSMEPVIGLVVCEKCVKLQVNGGKSS